jgi:hypothetical protein
MRPPAALILSPHASILAEKSSAAFCEVAMSSEGTGFGSTAA